MGMGPGVIQRSIKEFLITHRQMEYRRMDLIFKVLFVDVFCKKNFFWTLLSKLLTISGRLYCAHWTEVLLVGVVLFLQIELCLCIMKQITKM